VLLLFPFWCVSWCVQLCILLQLLANYFSVFKLNVFSGTVCVVVSITSTLYVCVCSTKQLNLSQCTRRVTLTCANLSQQVCWLQCLTVPYFCSECENYVQFFLLWDDRTTVFTVYWKDKIVHVRTSRLRNWVKLVLIYIADCTMWLLSRRMRMRSGRHQNT